MPVQTLITAEGSRNRFCRATDLVALVWRHARGDGRQGGSAPHRLQVGGGARGHARRQPLAGDALAARRRNRSSERRAGRPARARVVESAQGLRTGGGARLALRRQSRAGRPSPDRPRPGGPRRGADAGDPRRARRLVRVILWRCFAWSPRARADEQDGPLWFPRLFQGDGRHDNPDAYGCLYLADREASCAVEQLPRFRTQRLQPALLRRRGLPLALAAIELEDSAEVLDLDEPRTLTRERLRPSAVATRRREVTQPQALALHRARPQVVALRWWSTFEALWSNYTVFDRGAATLVARDVRELTIEDSAVVEAADLLGLRI